MKKLKNQRKRIMNCQLREKKNWKKLDNIKKKSYRKEIINIKKKLMKSERKQKEVLNS